MTQQWNASQSSANNTVSGAGNLIVSKTGGTGSNSQTYASEGFSSGLFYWEETLALSAGGGYEIDAAGTGIGNTSSATNIIFLGGAGTDTLGLFFAAAGDGFYNNGVITLATPNLTNAALIAAGGLTCRALDLTNNLFYVRLGTTGNWNGNASANPATQTGGVTIPAGVIAHPVVPAFDGRVVPDDISTAAFAQSSWAGSAPSGFGPFDAAGGTTTVFSDAGGGCELSLMARSGNERQRTVWWS